MPTTITSWNVNSIRARLDHVLDWLEENEPTLLCLQETKVQNHEFPMELFVDAGWNVHINGQRTYNGVALISREEITDVMLETGIPVLDEQKRIIGCTLNGVRVYNVYVPNGKTPESESFVFKEQWYKALKDFMIAHHKPDEKVVICGDYNVAPDDIDVHDPEEMRGVCCFHPSEQEWFENLKDWGFTDAFRALKPDEQAFTWWDYRGASFRRDRGMRIDHHLVSKPLMDDVTDVVLDRDERKKEKPSDHIPVTLVLK